MSNTYPLSRKKLFVLAFVLLHFLEMHLYSEILEEPGPAYSNCEVIDYQPG